MLADHRWGGQTEASCGSDVYCLLHIVRIEAIVDECRGGFAEVSVAEWYGLVGVHCLGSDPGAASPLEVTGEWGKEPVLYRAPERP